ncbi:tetratricopeptide repeat protein [Hyalangium versicolor]|uniref:tetratricopeptide repeat protein n=1 Tax=Hyalangium versicolor TaxID=2861190 RepID=UPI001CCADD7E|nr:tetratricopeptide repeat protein [Hyalangium versicolor]
MRSSHRGGLLAWGLILGLAPAAWGQGEFSVGPQKEKPVKEGAAPPAQEPPAPARKEAKASARERPPAPPPQQRTPETDAVDRCRPLTNGKAGQLASQAGEALENRRYFPAMKLLSDALRLQPDAGALHLAMAAALARVGEVGHAARQFEDFLQACPKHARVATVRKLLDAYHHTKGAQAFAASEVDELAQSLFAEEEGEALCDESQLPQEVRGAYDEGVRLLNAGKYARAADSFRHVLEQEPRSAMARLMLGSAYAQMDKQDEAAQAYMSFLTLCPDHPRAQEVRERVQASGVEAP